MYGKMQESGLLDIIPLISILTILGQYPVFLYPEFPSRCMVGQLQWLMAWWRATFIVYEMAGNNSLSTTMKFYL